MAGLLNPVCANVPFLYPLKLPENIGYSDVFRVYINGTLLLYGLKKILM